MTCPAVELRLFGFLLTPSQRSTIAVEPADRLFAAQASTFSAVKLMARAGTSGLGVVSVKQTGLCTQQVHPSLILNEYHDWVTS